MTTYKERERSRREREILVAARRLILEKGYNGCSMDDLAEAVGISKPTLYQHFKSKDELIVRVLVESIADVEDYLLSTTEDSPLERLKMALRLILVSRYGTEGRVTDFETDLLISSLHPHPDVTAAKRRVMTEVSRVVEEGKARGEISVDITTSIICCMIFKLIGLPAAALAARSPDSPGNEAENIDVLINNVVTLFARAIAREPSFI